MEKMPSNNERESEFLRRAENVFLNTKLVTIDLLLEDHPNLNRSMLESYLNSEGKDVAYLVDTFKSGLLGEITCDQDNQILELIYPDSEKVKKVISDQLDLWHDFESRQNINPNEEEKFYTLAAIQTIFDSRVDFLRQILSSPYEDVLNKKREQVVRSLAYEYLRNGKKIPSKLKLVMAQNDLREVQRMDDERFTSITDGLPEKIKEAIKERQKLREDEKQQMIDAGVYPHFANQFMDADKKREAEKVANLSSALEESANQHFIHVEDIVDSYSDPRDAYNKLIGVEAAKALAELVIH